MGRTVLMVKDSTKGNVPSNYRPITCLPVMWKLLTGVIAEAIYQHLDDNEVLPWEQTGCTKRKKRNQRSAMHRQRNNERLQKKENKPQAMAWVDYKKAHDMVPHSWILEVFLVFT